MKPVALASICACLLFAGAATAVEVPATYGDAMRWYRQAAEAGSANAQFFLGRMYETGQSRKRDPAAAAVTWYRKAADQGHRLAQYNLGVLLAGAGGPAADLIEAWVWLSLAADNGVEAAAAARDGVEKRMSESELGQARRRLEAQKTALGKKQ